MPYKTKDMASYWRELIEEKYAITLGNATHDDLTILESYFGDNEEALFEETSELFMSRILDRLEHWEKKSNNKPMYYFIQPTDTTQEYLGVFFQAKTLAGALLKIRKYAAPRDLHAPTDTVTEYFDDDVSDLNLYIRRECLKSIITRIEKGKEKLISLEELEKEIIKPRSPDEIIAQLLESIYELSGMKVISCQDLTVL